ncbi:heparan-alpha-glucosaminide N-acetyltransferase domain-containing protein [Nocardioides insulae]|uniref:heparan-alpha-glucosaminide N-acetyltransferase domain-containing protein n=1 Tax=Nocardioides insulae TaxID=394734 RepID=UPI000401F588|nr:heparan-alpha-glucosaminide N-acetyltransferase domain-containing protein [Nocardioides insulae]
MVRIGGRLVGLDVARCLALLGMMGTHVLDARTPTGGLTLVHLVAGGRASALFAVLAGVSLALMTGRATPVLRGADRRTWAVYAAGLGIRALLIAMIGLVLGALDTGIAVILTYYGVLFCCGIPFLALRARTLAIVAAAWVVAGPVLSQVLRPELPERGVESPSVLQLTDPLQMLSELFVTGYYPVIAWMPYLLIGIALGRLELRSPQVSAMIAILGAAVATSALVLSTWLTGRAGVAGTLADELGLPAGTDVFRAIESGMYGNTPTGGSWDWLLVVAPHSSTPFDVAQTLGSALLVIGLCLLVAGALPPTGVVATAVFFGAGRMTLTLYTLHVVMRIPQVPPADTPGSFGWHVLVVFGIGAVWVALGWRGPLERLVGWPFEQLRRLTRPNPPNPSAPSVPGSPTPAG